MMIERWPKLHGAPLGTGIIKQQPEDFNVVEVPAYPPVGNGGHLFLEIEKKNLTTDQAIKTICQHCRLPPSQVGCAGLKDKIALTRQWISIPAASGPLMNSFQHPNIRLVQQVRHTNKLKTGHLKGNQFRIRVRSLSAGSNSEVDARCQRILADGIPNYFGPQRFGIAGRNEKEGRSILVDDHSVRNRRMLRLLLSAIQSALFNDLLAARMAHGLFCSVLVGDVLHKEESGGKFLCTEPEIDQARMDRHEISPTGPMFGPKMKSPEGQAREMEQQVLANHGLSPENFSKYPKLTRGTRRPLRLYLPDLKWEFHQGSLDLSFFLPAGAYATCVIRELFSTP
jgi:tRNA pseudouridine13 synthase